MTNITTIKVEVKEALEKGRVDSRGKVLFFCDSLMIRKGKTVNVTSGVAIPKFSKKHNCFVIRHDSAIWELEAEHQTFEFSDGSSYSQYTFRKGLYLE